MIKNRSWLKGTFWNTLGSAMYGANSFVMLALVSRVGTVEETGNFGIAFTTAQLLYIVGLLGINHYQQTDYQGKYTFSVYVRAKAVSCVLMIVGCVLAVSLLKFSGEKAKYTIILTGLMMLNAIAEMFQSLFFQKNRLDLSGRTLFYRTLWSLLAFSIWCMMRKNILQALEVQVFINLIVTVYYAVRYTPELAGDRAAKENGVMETKTLIMECFPLFVSLLLMNVVINASKYGIEFFMDETAQGYYNMIFMPAQIINLCSQFLFKPFLNQYSEALSQDKWDEFYKMLKMQVIIVGIFTISGCMAAFLLGTQILGWLYDKDLSMQRTALVVIILAGGVFAICQLFYYIYVILRLQKQIMLYYMIGLAIAVIFAGLFITEFGIAGAAVSFLVTQGGILLCYVAGLVRRQRREI